MLAPILPSKTDTNNPYPQTQFELLQEYVWDLDDVELWLHHMIGM